MIFPFDLELFLYALGIYLCGAISGVAALFLFALFYWVKSGQKHLHIFSDTDAKI